MADHALSLLNFEEYLAIEQQSPIRHEFVGGTMHAIAGASRRNSEVTGTIFAALFASARAGGCRLFITDMKLRTSTATYYPDVMAVCAEPPDSDFYEESPCLLVEVLSPSTRQIDQREKLAAYGQIESLQSYLIVDPDLERITVHARDPDGEWSVSIIGPSEVAEVPCLHVSLSVDETFQL